MKRRLTFLSGLVTFCALITGCTPENHAGKGNEPEVPATVKITEVTNLTPSFLKSVEGVKANDEFEPGGLLTLNITPGEILSSGFSKALAEHIHVHVGDKVYMPDFPETDDEYVQSLTMEVAACEEDFGIVVAYAVQQQLKEDGYTMTLEENDDNIRLYGVSPEMKYKYFDCYLRTPDAYTISNVEFKVGDGEWQDVNSVRGCSFGRSESLDWVYVISIRPDYQEVTGDVTLRVTGNQHGRYKIRWKNTEYIRTDLPEEYSPNNLPEESIDGDEVLASFWTKDGYYLAGATADVSGLVPECISRAYVRFTMPASDVEITLDFQKKIAVGYTESAHVTDAQIYDAPDIYYGVPTELAIPGEEVYIFANTENGFKPSKAINDKGEESDFVCYGGGMDSFAWYAPVHIPEQAAAATVRINTVTAYIISGEEDVIFFNEGRIRAEGETVKFQVRVPQGQTLNLVSVKQPDGTEVPCTMDNTDGQFVMPASDVTVSATFKEVESGTTAHVSAIYDENQYRVFSQTNPYYQSITEEGFDVPAGTALYIYVQDDYGEPFWVGVQNGESISYYEATVDPDYGDATFGKTFTANGDLTIKVGATEESVKFGESDQVSVIAYFDPDEFIVRSSTDFSWKFDEGFKVDRGTNFYLTVENMYGEPFWVGIKTGDSFEAYEAVEDEDTGEYTFGRSIEASADVRIKAGSSKASVQL